MAISTNHVLHRILRALTEVAAVTKSECERAFGCALDTTDGKSFFGVCPALHIAKLDVRPSIIVVHFEDEVQSDLAQEIQSMGPPVRLDVVSPPIFTDQRVDWQTRWSATHTFSDVEIHFGFKTVDNRDLVHSVSRHFDLKNTVF